MECRRVQLLQHFGERFDPAACRGTCDVCKNRAATGMEYEMQVSKGRQVRSGQVNCSGQIMSIVSGHVRSGQIRSGLVSHIRSIAQVTSGQVSSGQNRSGQSRSGRARSDQIRPGQVRSGLVRSGQVRPE